MAKTVQSKPTFIGLDTQYRLATGEFRQRIHMDGAASPLAATIALQSVSELLPHYSNSHSRAHGSAQVSTEALAWAHQQVLKSLNANSLDYTAIFIGAGCTAAINRVARGLALARPKRKIVLVSAMEHHANDLPHRQFENQVHYLPLSGEGPSQGAVDLDCLQKLLEKYAGQVNYIAVSSVSNVTGIVNPIAEITRLAHQHDALVLVDGAQSVAHGVTMLSHDDAQDEADFFVFSGHKLYTPMGPGVLIAKKDLLQSLSGQDLGGGSVADVSYFDFQMLSQLPDKEQSGTPNIVGSVALARVMQACSEYGFDKIGKHTADLMQELYEAMSSIANITVYGEPLAKRLGALSFNHKNIDHGLLAAILNDYYAIAVRNACFCAHPYVSSMLKESLWQLDLSELTEDQHEAFINRKRGMVRVSISLYNSSNDIEYLVNALVEISEKIDHYRPHYKSLADGSYQHKTFKTDWRQELGW